MSHLICILELLYSNNDITFSSIIFLEVKKKINFCGSFNRVKYGNLIKKIYCYYYLYPNQALWTKMKILQSLTNEIGNKKGYGQN